MLVNPVWGERGVDPGLNGDGVWDAGEPVIATDPPMPGDYPFPGLPTTDGAGNDDYLVWVNDTDNVLGTMDRHKTATAWRTRHRGWSAASTSLRSLTLCLE